MAFTMDLEEITEDTGSGTGSVITEYTEPTIKHNYNLERYKRMSSVIGKFASTLCLRSINVHLETEPSSAIAPAWSDADNIWFGVPKLGKLIDPEVVVAVKGLSLHEISHILMTPRVGSNLGVWVKQNDLWRAFNALEDQRIETMITTKYRSIIPWLVATIAQHLLDKPEQYKYQFVLTHGRKYLPQEVRDAVRTVYDDQASVAELSQVIDEYITLNLADNKSFDRATYLIERYNELVTNMKLTKPHPYHDGVISLPIWNAIEDPNGHHNRREGELKSSSTSKPMSKAEQEALLNKIKNAIANGTYDPGDGGEDMFGGMPDPNAGQNEQSGSLASVLQHVLDKTMDDLAPDIDQAMRQYSGEAELNSKNVKPPKAAEIYHMCDTTPEVVHGSKSFGNELEMLRAEYDPSWDKRQDSGRLNVQRYALGCEPDEAFDRWELGREDAVDIECVVLLDTSPSMSWTIHKAYENMWAIKRALDKVNASTTVLAFDDKVRTLYDASERATTKYKYTDLGNGTEPYAALQYARHILANSDRAVKLIITITDGEWWGAERCDNIIAELRRAGVVTALAYVDDTEYWKQRFPDSDYSKKNHVVKVNTHGCEVSMLVSGASDLFKLAKRIVKVGVNRNLFA